MNRNRGTATSPLERAFGDRTPYLNLLLRHNVNVLQDKSGEYKTDLSLVLPASDEFQYQMSTGSHMLTNLAMKLYDTKFKSGEVTAPGSIQYMHPEFLEPFSHINELQQRINTLKLQEVRRPMSRSEHNTIRRKCYKLEESLFDLYNVVQRSVSKKTYNNEICVSTRAKSPERIISKIAAVPLEHYFDESLPTQVKDLFGLRVVVKGDEDIENAVTYFNRELKKLGGVIAEKPTAVKKTGHSSFKIYTWYKEGNEKILTSAQFQTCNQNLEDKRTHFRHEQERQEFFEMIRASGFRLDEFLAATEELVLPRKEIVVPRPTEEPVYSFV